MHKEIVSFLAKLELFNSIPLESLSSLVSSMTFVEVAGSETLIYESALEASLYILYHGRLQVLSKDGEEIAEITPGQIVGEIAPIATLPRTATVRALRDSQLLKLKKEAFEVFEKKHPEAVLAMAKVALKRLGSKRMASTRGEKITTLAVIGAGSSTTARFIHRLAEELEKIKPTTVVNGNFVRSKSLLSLEETFGFVIYQADREYSPWTEQCIRNADHILLIAEEGADATLNEIETALLAKSTLPSCDLVFLHPDNHEAISGTKIWLEKRRYHNYHHLRLASKPDFARFIRFMTGKAFGVVLNGGGVRAFAHVGVLKALGEYGIPIDFIGGNSMGAVIGAIYAQGGMEELLKQIRHPTLHASRKDYTFPFISLLRGKNVCTLYQEFFGEVAIEDLRTHFFCVSTNVTESKLKVYTSGPLWLALRASTALPAIYPPIFDESGNMHVDGAILNNMPVDVMRDLLGGGSILAVNCFMRTLEKAKTQLSSAWISGWKLMLQRLRGKKGEEVTIFSILRDSVMLGTVEKQKRMAELADALLEIDTSSYKMLDFGNAEEIVTLGYKIAKEKLPQLLK